MNTNPSIHAMIMNTRQHFCVIDKLPTFEIMHLQNSNCNQGAFGNHLPKCNTQNYNQVIILCSSNTIVYKCHCMIVKFTQSEQMVPDQQILLNYTILHGCSL